jgi:hypothetical protein
MLRPARERLGGGRFGPGVVFCLDQCDALAMHRAHAKLGLPCQSASLVRSYSCQLWRDVLTSIPNQIGADLRCAGQLSRLSGDV